ncbi:MAG: hypothetical protein GTO45_27660 [Candidatus Aminicenantes bacterium]|nr:hypothetical protein [Candidatus Aminicenantes bacterium]NIM82573.1 hypothetical protein [Candidatus Aminicenantes bacterium]NIN21933.1 hypothetical protein [Candidatus Aminicenantes bacterium]NIN45711.1 hypothetical protein [Candidatus Aminicenantes bacterium]NIN88546.1 hypothetical protein [Candidatus Aminicenantes bacterium]
MKKSLVFFLTLTVLFMFQRLDAGKVNVSGKWQMTIESPRGERTRDVEFVQDGENLKVIMTGRQGTTIEGKGTVKDNKIEWTITRETPRGTFTMTYKGTVDGDTMKGEVEMGGRGSRKWSATRKKG